MHRRVPAQVGSPYPWYVVAGGQVSAVTLEDTIRFTEEAILAGRRELVTTTNAYAATLARKDARLAQAFRASALVIPDGFYVTRVGRRRASRPVGRVRGTDTLVAFAELAARKGYTSYFYGGVPGIAGKVIAQLTRRFPGFVSAGAHSPPYRPPTPEEDEADVQRINAANPDVLWVGLGCPKQEIWAHEHRPRLNARVIVPV
ncbi:MAG TPA: WecB/TagA/CpsF family glycosyltransferase, partial [Candidatus Thermoplasmatota archaeon]